MDFMFKNVCRSCMEFNGVICKKNLVTMLCNVQSIYPHCSKCNLHHELTVLKSHCVYCGIYARKHFYCHVCFKCTEYPTYHCLIHNKCRPMSYFCCLKCGSCHSKVGCYTPSLCLRCGKRHQTSYTTCTVCGKCHDFDKIHCSYCGRMHWRYLNVFCFLCKVCVDDKHYHCSRCGGPIKSKILVQESRLAYALSLRFPIERQIRYGNRIFDIIIPSLNIIVEYDGEYHFMQISNWNAFGELRGDTQESVLLSRGATQESLYIIRVDFKQMRDTPIELICNYIVSESLTRFSCSNSSIGTSTLYTGSS